MMNTPAPSIDADFVPVRRFVFPDIADIGPWMLDRLRPKFPTLQDRNLHGWLRGAIDSSEYMFLKTPNAVGLAQRVNETMAESPVVIERFVLLAAASKEKQSERIAEGMAIYEEFFRWSANVCATELRVLQISDVPPKALIDRFRRLEIREQRFISLVKADAKVA